MPTLKCCVNLWGDKTLLRYHIHVFLLRKQQVFCGQKQVHLVKGTGHCDNPVDSVAMYTLWKPKVYLKTTVVFWSKEHNYHIIVVLNN